MGTDPKMLLLEEYNKQTHRIALEIITELKSHSLTYGEVTKKLALFKSVVEWDRYNKYDRLFDEVITMLEAEKNSILLND